LKRRLNNKAVSTVIAASILLAAIVTVAITYQAYIVPELNREKAYNHSQDVLRNFEGLYSDGKATIQLSYAGSAFFSSQSFPGQLSYSPSISVNASVYNANQNASKEQLFRDNTAINNIQSLSDASLYIENASDSIEATCVFTNADLKEITFQINTEETESMMRIRLNITSNLESTYYYYSIMPDDSFQISLFSPLYSSLTSDLSNTQQIQYTTNSPKSALYIKYVAATPAPILTYIANGALRYEPATFPLSYIATPWGVTALEAGNSSIPAPFQIYWSKDTLTLDLYNITWNNIGTLSGAGSVGLTFKNYNQTTLNSSFDKLNLNFTYTDCNLKNSIIQLETFLKNSAPEGTLILHQDGDNWIMLTVETSGYLNLSVHNVEAALS
jgi:hypothetical protein